MPNASERLRPGRLTTAVIVLSSLLLFVPTADASSHVKPSGKTGTLPAVTPASTHGPLRDLRPVRATRFVEHELDGPESVKSGHPTGAPARSAAPTGSMPSPSTSFAGLHYLGNCGGTQCGSGYPPDTVGDVGPNNYVEAVNTSIGVFSKTGTLQVSRTFNSLWAGSGTPCAANNQGDPTVVYDPMGDRWIIADFGFADFNNPPYYECIAVSKTADPTGAYWLYAVRGDDGTHPWFPDYPKMGVWPDGIYYSANMFDTRTTITYEGVRTYALERSTLEAGGTVTPVVQDVNANFYTLLPANLRGAMPPVDSPAYFVSNSATATYAWDVFEWSVDFATPANSVFTGPTLVSQTTYDVPGDNVVPQPSPGHSLDSLGDRLMMQAQYRNIDGVESIWVVHTVAPEPLKIQWAQLNVTGGTVHTNPVQEQIYNPGGGLYRWMPSLAVDKSGNMAVGFSTSSSSVKPALHYAGRLAGDPLNQLSQGEATLYQGTGVQSNNCGGAPCHRWGDYSAMTVDPTDDCTFWYVGEAYDTNGGDWQTHIGSFSYPTCGTVPVKPVALSDTGFIPTTLKVAQGSTVEWTNNGPSVNGVTDGTSLNLFDSGDLAVSDTFDFTYIAAGQYAVDDQLGHSMTVSVPLKIAPKSGHRKTRFHITWSSQAAPAGASFTIQYQRPHATKWRKFKVGVTGTHARFKPDAGTGRYHFRAKMVNASGSSAFSAETKLKVR